MSEMLTYENKLDLFSSSVMEQINTIIERNDDYLLPNHEIRQVLSKRDTSFNLTLILINASKRNIKPELLDKILSENIKLFIKEFKNVGNNQDSISLTLSLKNFEYITINLYAKVNEKENHVYISLLLFNTKINPTEWIESNIIMNDEIKYCIKVSKDKIL
jgi:hypothetical protein